VHLLINFCNISIYRSFLIHLPEDGHTSDRNMQDIYYIYSVLSHTYIRLLVLATILLCICWYCYWTYESSRPTFFHNEAQPFIQFVCTTTKFSAVNILYIYFFYCCYVFNTLQKFFYVYVTILY
jgi:hypothetical protein